MDIKERAMEIKKNIDDRRTEVHQKLRRNEMTLRVLELLSHGIVGSFEIFMACSPGGKYQKVRTVERRHAAISTFFENERDAQRFYSFLYFLQKSGLILKQRKEKSFLWRITKKGYAKQIVLRDKESIWLFPPVLYDPEPSSTLTIIIFDVSEKERNKREWLRRALQSMKFTMVQKSVWTGMFLLPPQFIRDLKELELVSCVKIFSAIELGNL